MHAALADARTVVNVGAGAGSYEPADRYVLAVEPSATMRAQRPPGAPPAIDARAEALPLDDGAVDAAMAVATVHHWDDLEAGLRELRRVARRRVVVLTFDPDAVARYWLCAYLPELATTEDARFARVQTIAELLDGRIEAVPIPLDCRDGFAEAYYGRPEAYLDANVRAAQSFWPLVGAEAERRAVEALAHDLASGAWDAGHGSLRGQPSYEGSLRLVVAQYD